MPRARSWDARASACSLVLVKTSVDLWASMSCCIFLARATVDAGRPSPDASSWSLCVGETDPTLISRPLSSSERRMLIFRFVPARNWAILSGSPIVAERPILWNSTPVNSKSRSKAMESWTPRSSVANSCTSSTTIHLTLRRCSFILLPTRIDWRVSGVVMSMSGGLFACRDRALIDVSPWRTWIFTSRSRPISSSLRNRSLLRARRGVM